MNRRSFLQWAGISLASLPFIHNLFLSPAQAEDLVPQTETDPQAKALSFCLNGDKPSAACKQRKDAKKKDQYCHNCQLFQKVSGDGKTAVGKCLLFAKKSVPGVGWCNSWVKRP